jgi:hypothetical protein
MHLAENCAAAELDLSVEAMAALNALVVQTELRP